MNGLDQPVLTKKQRRELRKQERLSDAETQRRRAKLRRLIIIGLVVLALGGGAFALTRGNGAADADLGPDTDPFKGPENARVVIEEYSDFQCPACKAAVPALPQLLDAFPADVKLVYNDYPLSIHPNSRQAAEAAQCAFVQGKFWDFHDRLFAEQETWSSQKKEEFTATLKKYAADLSLDQASFDRCLDQGEQRAAVSRDVTEGNRRKVNSTPTFFVNGVETVGAQTLDKWKEIVNSALAIVQAANANTSDAPSTTDDANASTAQ